MQMTLGCLCRHGGKFFLRLRCIIRRALRCRWNRDRGRDGAVSATPPSKPDRRFSRIRLSSQWVLRREGAALRLVPKRVDQTFGITQAKGTRLIPPLASPHGHSRWFSIPSFGSAHFHLPASLGSTVVTRFSATTDALTPASQARGLLARFAHQHRRVSLVASLELPAIPSPTINVSSGDRPAVRRFGSSPLARSTGFASHSKARPSTPTESSSRQRPTRGRLCYGLVVLVPLLSTPPHGDAVTVRYRTVLHRTGADFHRSVFPPSQAH